MKAAWRRMPAPFAAAIVLSAGAHAAVVLMAETRAPVASSATASPELTANLHLRVRPGTRVDPIPSPVTVVAPVPLARTRVAPSPLPATRIASTDVPSTPPPAGMVDTDSDERVLHPVPLTYPVIALPADDDPHRVGLVRLMLIVSSEGTVARSFVVASTLSQDYLDRIQRSFEDMRFKPAVSHGLPRAGWYEVVVNFDFDPDARPLL